MTPTFARLQELAEQRLISMRKHPHHDLWVCNYTEKAQFGKLWNDDVEQCRGLIVDSTGRVVARPFRKFFNIGERDVPIPDGPYEVWKKYDGSLGISYRTPGGAFCIATRGEFYNEQTAQANLMLANEYKNAYLNPSVTYLFEILYPGNRIVVDYGSTRELRLLGGYATDTGEWVPPSSTAGFPIAEQIGSGISWADGTPDALRLLETTNEEGFVIRWKDNDFRLKLKFPEYLRIHRLVTGVSLKHVWEVLRDDGPVGIGAWLSAVPEEFATWVETAAGGFLREFERILVKCQDEFARAPKDTRKEFAIWAMKRDYPHVLFALLDGKDWSGAIWKLLAPESNRAGYTWRKADE